jgi:hypothetical protein
MVTIDNNEKDKHSMSADTNPNEEHNCLFLGQIFPSNSQITISGHDYMFEDEKLAIKGRILVTIKNSQVIIQFISSTFIEDIGTLRNIAHDNARILIEAAGFYTGSILNLNITHAIWGNGSRLAVFTSDAPALKGFSESQGITIDDLFAVAYDLSDAYLQQSLSDMTRAMQSAVDTGFYCYRALESIRHYFKNTYELQKDGASWEKLRTELNFSREDIGYIKRFADAVRHGDAKNFQSVTSEERTKILQTSASVICRYVLYAKNGYKQFVN